MHTPRLDIRGQCMRELRNQYGFFAEKLLRLSDISTRQSWRREGNTRPNSVAITVAPVTQAWDTNIEYLLGLTDAARSLAAMPGRPERNAVCNGQ